jgi:hypothetical protein
MKLTGLASLALAFILSSATFAQATQLTRPDDPLSSDQAREENAYTHGVQAYLWGIPLAYSYDTLQGCLDEPSKRGLTRAAKAANQIVDAKWAATGETINGWR